MIKESINVLAMSATILLVNDLHCENKLEECTLYRLEKGMASHSSILAWRTLLTEEPGRL